MRFCKTECNPSVDAGNSKAVAIGDFTISNFGDGQIWIEDGEEDAMAIDESKLVEALRAFYYANL
jgi:hypothetical protein